MLTLKNIQDLILGSKQVKIVSKINHPTQSEKQDFSTLEMSGYSGVIEYHPDELVITVKAGTRLKQLNQLLADNNQATSFIIDGDDDSSDNKTIGSIYAKGNPDLRDAVLGIKIIDGRGRILNFGGQVMKNVAGYDVARLLAGSKGNFAIICEISFKVIPKNYLNSVSNKIILHKNNSKVRDNIEQQLKNIFDPNGIFI